MKQDTTSENLTEEMEWIIKQLDTIADDQAYLFHIYQSTRDWEPAQADPTSAISQIDMDILTFHHLFTVWLHRDLNDPAAMMLAETYIKRERVLIAQAEEERATLKFARRYMRYI